MRVYELIELLQNCPQNALVLYDFENAFTNDEDERMYGFERTPYPSEFHMGVDIVSIGAGTTKGFVYLKEDLIMKGGAENAD